MFQIAERLSARSFGCGFAVSESLTRVVPPALPRFSPLARIDRGERG